MNKRQAMAAERRIRHAQRRKKGRRRELASNSALPSSADSSEKGKRFISD